MNERQTNAMWSLDAALCNYNGIEDNVPDSWVLKAREELAQAYDEAYSAGCFPDSKDYPEYLDLLKNNILAAKDFRPFKLETRLHPKPEHIENNQGGGTLKRLR